MIFPSPLLAGAILSIKADDSALKRALQEAISKAAQAQERELIERVTRGGVFGRIMEAQDRMFTGNTGTLFVKTTSSTADANGVTYGSTTGTYADTSNGWHEIGAAKLAAAQPSVTYGASLSEVVEIPSDVGILRGRRTVGSPVINLGEVGYLPLRVVAEAAERVWRRDADIEIKWTWQGQKFYMVAPCTAAELCRMFNAKQWYTKIQQQEEQSMGALITISIRNIQDFDPLAVDLEAARFALAELFSIKAGYLAAGLDVPDWLAKKIRATKRSLSDRERDANAAEIARLEAEKRNLMTREDRLAEVDAKLAALKAKVGDEAE